jgi:hypothetical protein
MIMVLVNSATSKNLGFKSTMFPHRNTYKYTWTSPDGKTRNHIDHILKNRRWNSNILYIRYFRGADDCLVVAKVMERLAVSKQVAQKLMWKDLISGN